MREPGSRILLGLTQFIFLKPSTYMLYDCSFTPISTTKFFISAPRNLVGQSFLGSSHVTFVVPHFVQLVVHLIL